MHVDTCTATADGYAACSDASARAALAQAATEAAALPDAQKVRYLQSRRLRRRQTETCETEFDDPSMRDQCRITLAFAELEELRLIASGER